MSWASGYGELASVAPQAWAGPNTGRAHAPGPLNGLTPHHKLSYHHQEPAGEKVPQPHSIGDAALHVLVDPHPQAPCRAGSISTLPPESKGEPLLTQW